MADHVTDKLLQDLFAETVAAIKAKLTDPDGCTASDIRNALQLLKDNDITITPEEDDALKEAIGLGDLPSFETEDTIIN